jgi:hypothetical protein
MRTRSALGAIVLLPLAVSCSAFHRVPGASLAPELAERVDRVRVFLRDGTALELDEVIISPDSIIGRGGTPSTRLAVARSNVEAVDTRGTEPIATFVAGACAVLAGLFLMVRF